MASSQQQLFLAPSLDKTIEEFTSLFGLKPSKTKVAFVENAAIPYGDSKDLFWITQDRNALIKKGFELEEFDFTRFTNNDFRSKIKEFQVIHFCGGNTLYLNYLLHQSGFYQILQEIVSTGQIIYTGTSAGSMIVCEDLYPIKDELFEEIDLKYLKNITREDYYGLGLTPFLIIPHTNNPEFIDTNKKTIEKMPNYKNLLIFLRDNQAVLVKGNQFQIISN